MAMLEKEIVITGAEPRPLLRVPFPGPQAQRIVAEDHQYVARTTKTGPVTATRAKGSVVLTADGDLFLDFASGIGVLNVGHAHPRVVQAIQDQAAKFTHFAGTDFYYDVQATLARRLDGLVPGSWPKKTFLANSGTEANEAALKVAYWSQKRSRILAFQHAFHGRTLGSLSLTNSKTVHRARYPSIPGVHIVPFPDPFRNPYRIDGYADPDELTNRVLASLEDALDTSVPPDEVAAMFVEPVQGEGGYNVPPVGFFSKLKKVLDGHGILLVADEVQTGFGRTGKMFAMEHFGVEPAVTTMAKAMGSGLPIGAAVLDARLDFGVQGAHSNTYGGNPIACAASLATLDVLQQEKLVERAARLGPQFGKRLRELQTELPEIGDVRGLGFMWAAEWIKDSRSKAADKDARDRVVRESHKRGLIVLPCGKSAVRIIPPLVLTEEQLQNGMDVLREAARAARA